MGRRVATGGKSEKKGLRKSLKSSRAAKVPRRRAPAATGLEIQLSEALEQQAATASILKTISRTTIDLQAVLDNLVETAANLCRADRVAIRLVKDGAYHHLASFGFSPEQKTFMKQHAWRPDRSSVGGRAVLKGVAVHVMDVKADPELKLMSGRSFENVRSILGAPLMRDGKPIGALILMRRVVQPFTDKQIELATTFADQAVIAIENTRLLNELRQRTDDLTNC